MTRVTGTLHHVLGNAEAITEVWVRSARARGHGGGWLMETSARTPITDAHLSLDITPGPAILVAVAEGQPLEHIEIIVPDADSETLEHCITAAQGTSGRSAEVLDLLRQQIASDLSESAKAVTVTRAAADDAETSAQAAAGSATEAAHSASSAKSYAHQAAASAGEAKADGIAASEASKAARADASAAAESMQFATAAMRSARESEGSAKTAVTEAKGHANRAERVVDTVRWDADRLTVMGKTSPSLRGPKGPRGEQGDSGASTWDAITEKPDTFPPTAHQHKMKDITDLPRITSAASLSTIMQRDSNGRALIYSDVAPQQPYHVTHKKYVDDQDKSTLAEARALVETRAVVKQVTSPPSTQEPGVLYVIPE